MVPRELTLNPLDEYLTYGNRLGSMYLRTAVMGGEIAVGLVYCTLQVFNHSFCPNRDLRNPLKPCKMSCHCAKTAIYDVHGLNETALYKVSFYYSTEQLQKVVFLQRFADRPDTTLATKVVA